MSGKEIIDLVFTSATELEFWVKTPLEEASVEEMSAAEIMQEQYWERTHGAVRCALEQAILELDKYGLKVEMGHKEVGGLKAQIDESGHLTHVCEQLEIDWRFSRTRYRRRIMKSSCGRSSRKFSARTAWRSPSKQSR